MLLTPLQCHQPTNYQLKQSLKTNCGMVHVLIAELPPRSSMYICTCIHYFSANASSLVGRCPISANVTIISKFVPCSNIFPPWAEILRAEPAELSSFAQHLPVSSSGSVANLQDVSSFNRSIYVIGEISPVLCQLHLKPKKKTT